MCGICGIYNYQNHNPAERGLLRQMAEKLTHRGPDEEGFFLDKDCGLGHTRLKIIDLDTGRQPLANEDGSLWIVFNGEIYNYKELREQLCNKGHVFKTKTDTEVIVHLYEEKGAACLQDLRGMFAFALWDKQKRELFLARDRIGQKPLYYMINNGSFYFASEMPSLRTVPEWKPVLNKKAVTQYCLYGYVPAPHSIFEQVHKLLPAHYMTVSQDHVTVTRYWQLNHMPKTNLSLYDCVDKLEGLIDAATSMRMMSDVPLGAFLSGGLDSSLIVALMARHSSRPIKTFSIAFPHKDFNESRYARLAAEHCGTDHKEYTVRPDASVLLNDMVRHMGEPFGDSSSLAMLALSKLTRQHVTVALNGDGGDENFAGYPRYQAARRWFSVVKNPIVPTKTLMSLGSRIFRATRHGMRSKGIRVRAARFFAESTDSLAELYSAWMCHGSQKYCADLLCAPYGDYVKDEAHDFLSQRFNDVPDADCVDTLLHVDALTYLPDDLLVKTDRSTMACSLEARSPLLDHEVMEFAASLPVEYKLRRNSSKHILKLVAKKYLPREIVERKKMGFGVPVSEWLQKELNEYCRSLLLSDSVRERGVFNQEQLRIMIEAHSSGKINYGHILWNLLIFELWCRIMIDGEQHR